MMQEDLDDESFCGDDGECAQCDHLQLYVQACWGSATLFSENLHNDFPLACFRSERIFTKCQSLALYSLIVVEDERKTFYFENYVW